jgi:hypothetical protein
VSTSKEGGPLFWVSAALGTVLIGFGVRGLLHDAAATKPGELARWFFGAGAIHDFVWVPLTLLAGLATRRVPPIERNPVRIGLAVSVVLTFVTWPLVQRWGASAANPSALPLDYGRNLVATLLVCWFMVACTIAVRALRPR